MARPAPPPGARLARGLLIAVTLISLLWVLFSRVNVVAGARGKIAAGAGTNVIRSAETATIKTIRVADGQAVKAGDVLLEIDAGDLPPADPKRAADNLVVTRLQLARAQAMLAAIVTGEAPQLPAIDGIDHGRLMQDRRILDGLYREYRAKLADIDADVARTETELAATRETVLRLRRTAPAAQGRDEDSPRLAFASLDAESGDTALTQARSGRKSELAAQENRLKELTAALNQGRSQKIALVAEARRTAIDGIEAAERKAVAQAQELIQHENRGRATPLAAPADGAVRQLAALAVGSVVTPAQPLMSIVPQDETLEVEAMLEDQDIGFVHPGLEAEVEIETAPGRYGSIPARVTQVSNVAVDDKTNGRVYPVRLKLDGTTTRTEARAPNPAPGMPAKVAIKTDRHRLIEYLLAPLIGYWNEGLRAR